MSVPWIFILMLQNVPNRNFPCKRPSIPDHLSSDLKDLLNLLLEKDPDRRIGIQEIRVC